LSSLEFLLIAVCLHLKQRTIFYDNTNLINHVGMMVDSKWYAYWSRKTST